MTKKPCVISCAVLAKDLRHHARQLKLDVDFKFLEAGLHNNPKKLKEKLQAAINQVSGTGQASGTNQTPEANQYSRIIIGYGICGKGTIGVQSHIIPLVIPKVHDCIALFLGGDQAYKDQFEQYPGTFYLSAGWCEQKTEPMSQRKESAWFGDIRLNYTDLVEKHGKTAANTTFDFLNSWQKNYQRAAFIETSAGNLTRHKTMAQDMAKEYGWDYEKIQGSPALFKQMLTTTCSTPEVLFVPPKHVIGFDPICATLSTNPLMPKQHQAENQPVNNQNAPVTQTRPEPSYIKIGLGIDAGGTYTDAVLYDLEHNTTCFKSKALTTKWDFTKGILNALKQLPPQELAQAELVSVSTTLATNAIVENEGQKVGMILMPPYGLDMDKDISYHPKTTIQGQLEITGNIITPVDSYEVKKTAAQMVRDHHVTAFAVSGYAGSINPEQEQLVKKIIQQETGCFVSCGHELSDTLNFQTRARTAMLNARIIPRLERLLSDLETVMADLGIIAPIVVVKGDGTLMTADMARKQPVETILSGPAASVAGARYLTGIENAMVVDMGGTTTDTALLIDNQVTLNEKGSTVGPHRTHVKALDIRTIGLGGDSLISFEKAQFYIGPKRVAPISWLGQTYPGTNQAIEYLNQHLHHHTASTYTMQILVLTGTTDKLDTTPLEKNIISLLEERPFSIDELVEKTKVLSYQSLPLERLEEHYIIQRCGLTLTDLLHINGQFVQWDIASAAAYGELFCFLSGLEQSDMIQQLMKKATNLLTKEIIKRQISHDTDPDTLDHCPTCQILLNHVLTRTNPDYAIGITLNRPVIGIGAPIQFFLPNAVKPLKTKAILPKDADVANAIGAITSHVVIKKKIRIVPGSQGGFRVEGISGLHEFKGFDQADRFARESLTKMVQDKALQSGTSCRTVIFETCDQLPSTSAGDTIFISRTIHAQLTGQPDRIVRSI